MLFSKNARVEVVGANFGELVALIQKEQIAINFRRINDTVMLFETSSRNLPILFDILSKKCYTYKVYRTNALGMWQLLGVLVGALLMFTSLIIVSQFCLGIKVITQNPDIEMQINQYLSSQRCINTSWKEIDCNVLETQILSAIPEVSMVNVCRKGVFLVINTSSSTPPQEIKPKAVNDTGVFAQRDGIISRIFVTSGTALVREGDSVSAGQMLVAPYSLDAEGNKTPAVINADVYMYLWESSCVEFTPHSTMFVRTGNFVTATKSYFGGSVLSMNNAVIPYSNYETIIQKKYLSSLLPIVIETTYYYETEATDIIQNFDDEKEVLIYEAKQKLFSKINENEALEQKYTINKIEDKYYINYYAKLEYKVG